MTSAKMGEAKTTSISIRGGEVRADAAVKLVHSYRDGNIS